MINPGRRITYLRVSVTDPCNFRCTYSLRELTIRPALGAALTNNPSNVGPAPTVGCTSLEAS